MTCLKLTLTIKRRVLRAANNQKQMCTWPPETPQTSCRTRPSQQWLRWSVLRERNSVNVNTVTSRDFRETFDFAPWLPHFYRNSLQIAGVSGDVTTNQGYQSGAPITDQVLTNIPPQNQYLTPCPECSFQMRRWKSLDGAKIPSSFIINHSSSYLCQLSAVTQGWTIVCAWHSVSRPVSRGWGSGVASSWCAGARPQASEGKSELRREPGLGSRHPTPSQPWSDIFCNFQVNHEAGDKLHYCPDKAL